MTHIPGFQSAQRAYENMTPYENVEECESGDCDECVTCLAVIAQDQADALAEGKWEDARIERRFGA